MLRTFPLHLEGRKPNPTSIRITQTNNTKNYSNVIHRMIPIRPLGISAFLLLLAGSFFTQTAVTEIYTLSLHDALPICNLGVFSAEFLLGGVHNLAIITESGPEAPQRVRSEEHTSELQSRRDLVCRLLLEKKNASDVSSALGRPKTKPNKYKNYSNQQHQELL